MATETQAVPAGVKPYRLSFRQYFAMIGAGVFPDDARVELLGGVLVRKMTRYPPHAYCVLQLATLSRGLVPAPWLVSEEKPVELGRYWCLEPDIAVVRGPSSLFRARFMAVGDLGFLAEVSESSHAQDRGLKWRGYASARVPIYWIVNLPKRQVEVYRDPAGRGRKAAYRSAEVFGVDATVPVVIGGHEVGRVAVRDILP